MAIRQFGLSLVALSIVFTLPAIGKTHQTHNKTQKVSTNSPSAAHFYTGIKVSGYLEASYNHLTENANFVHTTLPNRAFDTAKNGFALQQAALTLTDTPKMGFGAFANILFGRDANVLGAKGSNADLFRSQNAGIDITQLYAQYSHAHGQFSVGKSIALLGVESIDPRLNANFSRSLLFTFTQPHTLTGARMIYLADPKTTLMLGVNNGWDSIRDWNRTQTVELGIKYKMTDQISLAATGLAGAERAMQNSVTGVKGTRTLADLAAIVSFNEQFNITVNFDYGNQSKAYLPTQSIARAQWLGIAGTLNYLYDAHWVAAFRAEQFNDKDGYRTGIRQNLREMTATVGYKPSKNSIIRAEVRRDYSNAPVFVNWNGNNINSNQASYAIEGVYSFA